MEAQAESWRAKLIELFTHPSEHVGFWVAVFAVAVLLMVASRRRG